MILTKALKASKVKGLKISYQANRLIAVQFEVTISKINFA